jgi:hypothetical protein
MSRGAASASFGAAPGTAMDMNDGMGAAEAISTNAAGGATGLVAGAGTAAMIGAAGGAHRQDTAAERASRGIGGKVPARALGFAGNTVTGAQAISDAIDDPDHAGGAFGGGLGAVGGGAGGAYIGGALGALGGPLALVTVPLGGAIGGVIVGEVGQRALEPVGQAIQNLFK